MDFLGEINMKTPQILLACFEECELLCIADSTGPIRKRLATDAYRQTMNHLSAQERSMQETVVPGSCISAGWYVIPPIHHLHRMYEGILAGRGYRTAVGECLRCEKEKILWKYEHGSRDLSADGQPDHGASLGPAAGIPHLTISVGVSRQAHVRSLYRYR
jgi:hypothetical protein